MQREHIRIMAIHVFIYVAPIDSAPNDIATYGYCEPWKSRFWCATYTRTIYAFIRHKRAGAWAMVYTYVYVQANTLIRLSSWRSQSVYIHTRAFPGITKRENCVCNARFCEERARGEKKNSIRWRRRKSSRLILSYPTMHKAYYIQYNSAARARSHKYTSAPRYCLARIPRWNKRFSFSLSLSLLSVSGTEVDSLSLSLEIWRASEHL